MHWNNFVPHRNGTTRDRRPSSGFQDSSSRRRSWRECSRITRESSPFPSICCLSTTWLLRIRTTNHLPMMVRCLVVCFQAMGENKIVVLWFMSCWPFSYASPHLVMVLMFIICYIKSRNCSLFLTKKLLNFFRF